MESEGSGMSDDTVYARWIEAKGKRKSRDWTRGKAAFEVTWGPIEEVDR